MLYSTVSAQQTTFCLKTFPLITACYSTLNFVKEHGTSTSVIKAVKQLTVMIAAPASSDPHKE